jgi:putative spermidine/putrescine transport system permease protein
MSKQPTSNAVARVAYSLVTLGLILPIAALVYLSLVNRWEFPQLFGADFTLGNWADAVSGTSGLWESFFTSLGIAAFIGLISTAGGFVVSRAIMYHRRGQLLLSMAYYPYLIAPVILGVMLQFYFIKLGISGTLVGVVTAQMLFIFPYAVLFFAGFWTPQTQAIEGQAKTLGAGQGQVLKGVLLPMAKEWLYICFFQCFMISWFEYGVTQYAGIGKVSTLTVRTMQYVKEANPHVAAVAACLMVLPLVAFLLLNRRFLYRNTEAHD